MNSEELDELSQKGEDMKQAVMRVRKLSASELLRIEEEAKEKARRDREDEILGGILKGQKQGRMAEKEEMARKMLKAGSDINFIQTVTELSKDHILKLKDKTKM